MKIKEMGLSILILIIVIFFGFWGAKTITSSIEPQKKEEISIQQDPLIEKIEDEEIYTYKITDFERKLTYSWKYKKETEKNISIEESLAIKPDFTVTIDGETRNTEAIQRLASEKKRIITLTNYTGSFLEATIKIDVSDQFREGEKLYLYYFNSKESKIEFAQDKILVENGNAEFTTTFCADYFLTNKIVEDALNNPRTINVLILGLIFLSLLLLTFTILELRKK